MIRKNLTRTSQRPQSDEVPLCYNRITWIPPRLYARGIHVEASKAISIAYIPESNGAEW